MKYLRLASASLFVFSSIFMLHTSGANATTAAVTVGSTPVGVWVDSATSYAYVANAADNSISVVDSKTNAIIAKISVGAWPNVVTGNPITDMIYVTNLYGGTVSVIDGSTETVTGTIQIGNTPGGVGVDDSTNTVYVTNSSTGVISVINGQTNQVISTVRAGITPAAMAVDPTTNQIYVPNQGSNDVSVIDGKTNRIVATVPVGINPWDAKVDTATGLVYVSSNSAQSSIYVIDERNNSVVNVLNGVANEQNIAVDSNTNTLFGTTSGGPIFVVNLSTGQLSLVAAGCGTTDLDVNLATQILFATSSCGNSLLVLPESLLPNPNQRTLAVSNTTLTANVGTPVTLTTSGGSGLIIPSFTVTGLGCSISEGQLQASRFTTCVVTATNPANGYYNAAISAPQTFHFFIPQSTLTISTAKFNGVAGAVIKLKTTGGKGSGSVGYSVVGANCTLSGSNLSASGSAQCVVTATKAASGVYGLAVSVPITINFSLAAQSILRVANHVLKGVSGSPIALTASGGSGSGELTFSATGTGCTVNDQLLTDTSPGKCSVQVTKAASGIYAAAVSSSVNFTFTRK